MSTSTRGTPMRSPSINPYKPIPKVPSLNPIDKVNEGLKGPTTIDPSQQPAATSPPRSAAVLPPGQSGGMFSKAASDYRFAGTAKKFDPYQQAAGPSIQAMNFDPYRNVATNAAQSSAQEGLTRAAGLSGADRMKAFSDFNRAKIMGTLQGGQKYDQAQGQNLMDVNRFNASRGLDVAQKNTLADNEAAQFNAKSQLARDQNLYAAALAEKNLDRKLEISKLLGQSQMEDPSLSFFDKLLLPFKQIF